MTARPRSMLRSIRPTPGRTWAAVVSRATPALRAAATEASLAPPGVSRRAAREAVVGAAPEAAAASGERPAPHHPADTAARRARVAAPVPCPRAEAGAEPRGARGARPRAARPAR